MNTHPHAGFRFYEEPNDFLPPEKRKVKFDYPLLRRASVKDICTRCNGEVIAVDKNDILDQLEPRTTGILSNSGSAVRVARSTGKAVISTK